VEMRQEEIHRYQNMENDPEVEAWKKDRELSPEYAEKQARLRSASEIVSRRLGELERFVEDAKRKNDQAKSGRHSMQMPTLEAIARTLPRIQKAAQVKLKEIDALQHRVQNLKLVDGVSDDAPIVVLPNKLERPSTRRKPTLDTPETRADAAIALNSERSAKRLHEVLLQLRPDAPRLNRSAMERARAPKQPSHMQPKMPSTSHLKLTLTIDQDKSALPSWAQPSAAPPPSSMGTRSTLVRKTSDSKPPAAEPKEVHGFSGRNAIRKLEITTSARKSVGPSLNDAPPRVGPIPRQSTHRGYGLHDA